MEFKIIITPDAEADLDRIINYLLFEKYNRQAASNVLNDFEETKRIRNYSVPGSASRCAVFLCRQSGSKKADQVCSVLNSYKNSFNISLRDKTL